MGFKSQPVLGKNMVGKMGLKGIEGVIVSKVDKPRGNSNAPPKRDGVKKPRKPRSAIGKKRREERGNRN